MRLTDALRGRFVVVNLGSGGDAGFDLPPKYLSTLTVVEVDAGDRSGDRTAVHARHSLAAVVAGARGTGWFTTRAWIGSSSMLEPDDELVRRYGLERYHVPRSVEEVETRPLPELLESAGTGPPDLIKTDVEGMDLDVLRGARPLLGRVLAVKAELRFEPFYVGEPPLHEALAFLAGEGFELVGLRPEVWKPATPRSDDHRDGRTVWADCVFLRRADRFPAVGPDELALLRAKQVLLARMLGHRGYGEFLVERFRGELPAEWHAPLWELTAPRPRRRLRRVAGLLRSRVARLRADPREFDFSHVVR